jgi:hypothetical protein
VCLRHGVAGFRAIVKLVRAALARPLAAALIAGVTVLAAPVREQATQPLGPLAATGFGPGARVLLDAHNCYPAQGRWADRLERALATGVPLAIEQDLVWRPASATRAAHSIVSHGKPFTGAEPDLRTHFFERLRPIVERALRDGDRREWPLVTLNLDFKTEEAEHLAAIWALLGEYESWLTTAPRTADPSIAATLTVGPLLVLTGDSDRQQAAFHDAIPIGGRLRAFGAVATRPAIPEDADEGTRTRLLEEHWKALPTRTLPRCSNYRRWWNNAWSLVESGGQAKAGQWTSEDAARLRTLVANAHAAALWVRFYTLNGHAVDTGAGWSTSYNFGSLDAARERWRAAREAGVDFVATDQYEDAAIDLRAR